MERFRARIAAIYGGSKSFSEPWELLLGLFPCSILSCSCSSPEGTSRTSVERLSVELPTVFIVASVCVVEAYSWAFDCDFGL